MFGLTQFFVQVRDILAYPQLLLEIIRSLQYQKLSLLFKNLNHAIRQDLSEAKLRIGSYDFVLSPELIRYFPQHLSDFTPGPDEPTMVQRIKKVILIVQHFQNLFQDIETLYVSPINPHGTVDQLKLVSALPRMQGIIQSAHELFREIFDLGLDAESWFGPENNSWLHDLLSFSQALSQPQQQLEIEQRMRLSWKSLSQAGMEQVIFFKSASIPSHLGHILGLFMQKMAAGDENFQFLANVLNDLPSVLQHIQIFVKQSLGVDDLQTNIVELKRLEDRTRESLKGINYIHGISFKNVFKIVNLISHLRSILDAVQSYKKTVGDLQQDLQTAIKQKLLILKFDYLFNFFVILDDLEIHFMLAPGELSRKFPEIQDLYSGLIRYLSDHVQFTEKDKTLVNLMDAQWHNRRIELSYRRQAQVREKSLELKNLAAYITPFPVSVEDFQKHFFALKSYLRMTDDAYYNETLMKLKQHQDPGPLPPALGKKLLAVLHQEELQLKFQEQRLLSSHHYLNDLQKQVIPILSYKEHPTLKSLKQSLWFQSAIVRVGEESYFYNGHSQSMSPLPSASVLQAHELSVKELLSLGSMLQEVLKNPEWMAAYWDETFYSVDEHASLGQLGDGPIEVSHATISLDELHSLLHCYQAQMMKLKQAKTILIEVFNFIQSLSLPYDEVWLTPENFQTLLYHYLRVGPYLAESLEPLTRQLSQNKLSVKMLKDWSWSSMMGLIDNYDRHLELYEARSFEIRSEVDVRKSSDALQGFQALLPLERVGFLIHSARYSGLMRKLRENLSAMQSLYAPEFVRMLPHEQGYCPQLLEAPVRLSQAQQTLAFQFVWNAAYFLEQFIVKLESWQHYHLEPSYGSVSEKVDMVVAFLKAQAYFSPGLGYLKQQGKVLTQAYQDMKKVLTSPQAQLSHYVLHQNDLAVNASGLEQIFHWILNGDEIFKDMVRPHYTEPHFKERLEAQTQATMAKLRVILQQKNYFNVITSTFSMYRMMKEVKGRFDQLVAQIYQVNQEHLSSLKQELFGDLIQIIDNLEVKLGLNPSFFSQIFVECLDKVFEHYLLALNLEPLKFAQLMQDSKLSQARINLWQLRIQSISSSIEAKDLQRQQMQRFAEVLSDKTSGLVNLDPDGDIYQHEKQHFLDDILPIILDMQISYDFMQPKAFLTPFQQQVDTLIQAWIDNSLSMLRTHDYLNRIKFAVYFVEGQIKTLKLEQQLLQAKVALLNQQQALQQIEQPAFFSQICAKTYHESLAQCLIKHAKSFKYMQQDYLARMQTELPLLSHDLEVWQACLRQQFEAKGQGHFVSIQEMIQFSLHQRFEPLHQTLGKSYQFIDSVFAITEEFLSFLNHLPSEQSWLNLRVEKIHTLMILKLLMADSNLSIEERGRRISVILQDAHFKSDMGDRGSYAQSGLSQVLAWVWRGILNLLSYFGLILPAQQPRMWRTKLDQLNQDYRFFAIPPSRGQRQSLSTLARSS